MYLRPYAVSAVWLITLIAAPGARPQTPAAGIGRVVADLTNIAMKEEVSRFVGTPGSARRLDTFEAEVSIADGVEQYGTVRGLHRTYRHISEIHGLWTFGELVTMLQTTRELIDNSTVTTEQKTSDGTVIRFHGAASDRLWFLSVAGRIFWFDFDGTIRLSSQTGEIESLSWTSGAGPPGSGIAGIFWQVNFSESPVAGDLHTMPSDSVFRVVRTGPSRAAEWNVTRYTALGRYGSTSSVSFGE